MGRGRKPKFTSPEQMQEKIEAYFADCEGTPLKDDNGQIVCNKYGDPVIVGAKPRTVTGLALALGFLSRRALLDYQAKPAYKEIIETAKLRIENYSETRLFDKDGVNGAKFTLQNNFGWNLEKEASDEGKAPAVTVICDIPRVPVSTQGNATQDVIEIVPPDTSGGGETDV